MKPQKVKLMVVLFEDVCHLMKNVIFSCELVRERLINLLKRLEGETHWSLPSGAVGNHKHHYRDSQAII